MIECYALVPVVGVVIMEKDLLTNFYAVVVQMAYTAE